MYELHIFELRDKEISLISQRYGRVRIPASLKIFGLTFLSDISCVFNCVVHLLYVYVIVLFFVLLFFYFMLKSWLCYYLFFRQETERSQTSIHGAA